MPCTEKPCRCFTCFVPPPVSGHTAGVDSVPAAAAREVMVSAGELHERWTGLGDEQRDLDACEKRSWGVEVDRFGTPCLLNTAGGGSYRHEPVYKFQARRRDEEAKLTAAAAAAAAAARLVRQRRSRAPRVLRAAGTPSVATAWAVE